WAPRQVWASGIPKSAQRGHARAELRPTAACRTSKASLARIFLSPFESQTQMSHVAPYPTLRRSTVSASIAVTVPLVSASPHSALPLDAYETPAMPVSSASIVMTTTSRFAGEPVTCMEGVLTGLPVLRQG